MNATTAAIDLAKNVLEQHGLTRAQFEHFFDHRSMRRVIMEAFGSAHHWGSTVRSPRRRGNVAAALCAPQQDRCRCQPLTLTLDLGMYPGQKFN